jgi:hypothetical protein
VNRTTTLAVNAYAQALNAIEQLEKGMETAIGDFIALKKGELSLDDLVVSDNGWEFVPPSPVKLKKEAAS